VAERRVPAYSDDDDGVVWWLDNALRLEGNGDINGAHALLDELLVVERTVVDGVVVVGALGEVGLALEHLLAMGPAEAVAALQVLCLLLDLLGLGGEPADIEEDRGWRSAAERTVE
jgi:hypothetical protein